LSLSGLMQLGRCIGKGSSGGRACWSSPQGTCGSSSARPSSGLPVDLGRRAGRGASGCCGCGFGLFCPSFLVCNLHPLMATPPHALFFDFWVCGRLRLPLRSLALAATGQPPASEPQHATAQGQVRPCVW
jgi:hypothetical protein